MFHCDRVRFSKIKAKSKQSIDATSIKPYIFFPNSESKTIHLMCSMRANMLYLVLEKPKQKQIALDFLNDLIEKGFGESLRKMVQLLAVNLITVQSASETTGSIISISVADVEVYLYNFYEKKRARMISG